jgi:hypothetical protein
MAWKATGSTDLPLADQEDWDGDEAEDQILEWAGWPDNEDPDKAKEGFFAMKDDEGKEKQSYKLPFAVVIDGELQAVPAGIEAVANVLEGGRGGVDLPDDVIPEVRAKVERYYDKMDQEVPW